MYKDRIAAGLIGEGSECFGFDDRYSTDHDFGPAFCLWLTDEDYREIGAALAEDYTNLPKTFRGFPARNFKWRPGSASVSSVSVTSSEGYPAVTRHPKHLMTDGKSTRRSFCADGRTDIRGSAGTVHYAEESFSNTIRRRSALSRLALTPCTPRPRQASTISSRDTQR